jgi:hypothetical protein
MAPYNSRQGGRARSCGLGQEVALQRIRTMAAGCWLRLPRLLLLLAAVLRPRSEEGASVAAAKELMRARCSACEAVAWELESWLRPPTKAEASAREAEEQRLRKVASDASLGTGTDGTGSGVARLERIPHTWRPLPLAIGELRTVRKSGVMWEGGDGSCSCGCGRRRLLPG